MVSAAVALTAMTACDGGPAASAPALAPENGTPQPTTSARPQTPAPTAPASWEATLFNRPEPPSSIAAVTEGGPGLVAVGRVQDSGAVWILPSGGEWERVDAVPERSTPNEFVFLTDVAVAPFGIVAVGITGTQPADTFSSVIWLSTDDGATWEKGQLLEGAEISSVATGGPGMVAVGQVTTATERPAGVSVWTTNDGVSWTKAEGTGELGRGAMNGIVSTESGFVAVGTSREDPNQALLHGAVWTSPDATAWTRVPHGPEFENASMRAVTVRPEVLLAVGNSGAPGASGPTAWTSADGSEWQRLPAELGEAVMLGVTAVGGSLAAVGFTGTYEDPTLALWTSADGVTWTEVPEVAEEGRGQLHDAVAFDGGIVAGGYAGPAEEDYHPIVIVGRPPD